MVLTAEQTIDQETTTPEESADSKRYTVADLKLLLDWFTAGTLDAIIQESDTNLCGQAGLIVSLKSKIQRLQTDIFERQKRFEENLHQLRKCRDEEIESLRSKREGHLDKGDRAAADAALDEIALCHKNLRDQARSVEDASGAFADLQDREKELHREALRLAQIGDANMAIAKALRSNMTQPLMSLDNSVGRGFDKLEKTIRESKKIAAEILGE